MEAAVHPRVFERHPELDEQGVLYAWRNFTVSAVRVPREREVRLGYDLSGRELEMIAVALEDGSWLIYHAFSPPTKKMRREIDALLRSRR